MQFPMIHATSSAATTKRHRHEAKRVILNGAFALISSAACKGLYQTKCTVPIDLADELVTILRDLGYSIYHSDSNQIEDILYISWEPAE